MMEFHSVKLQNYKSSDCNFYIKNSFCNMYQKLAVLKGIKTEKDFILRKFFAGSAS